MKRRVQSKDLGVDEDNIKIYLKYGGRVWTGFIWIRLGINSRLL
jgi:hypothetical protein